ncbi:MAG: general secretion pathway protein GspK [Candidatus Wallbacteria bacterium]|nr:general secretion pathway protein GspK [Candidatus Wallbacteria bacterium]
MIVLSILILLATMAYSFHDLVSSQLAISRKDVDRFRAIQLAQAGLNLAITLVKLDPQYTGGYTYLPDPAYQSKLIQAGGQPSKLEEIYLLMRASEATGMPLENGSVAIKIRDEMGRFNLNAAEKAPEFLVNLLKVCNVRKRKKLTFSDTTAVDDISTPLANSILDWLDKDSTSRPEGAESSYYSEQTPSYRARNGPFESIDELMLLRHMDRRIMDGVPGSDTMPASLALKEFVTIFGATAQVNANAAPPEVLAAVPGIFESANRQAIVAKLLESRPLRDFGAVSSVVNAADPLAWNKAAPYLGPKSNLLRIQVKAHLGSYDGAVETVILREPDNIRYLYWRES